MDLQKFNRILSENFNDDANFLQSILEIIENSYQANIERIEVALREKDAETAHFFAHKLKNHFRYFDAKSIHEKFKSVEELSKANNLDKVEIDIFKTRIECATLLETLRNYLQPLV